MEKEVAREVLAHLNVASEKFNTSIRVVLDNCPESEFLKYREEVAKIMAELYIKLMVPIHKAHPDLEPEQLRLARVPSKN
ncbi:hypothetical protein HH213_23400 [Duganella dendranthematis]|uniref:Uncharacterized protein n=1 Tax=Duganella dendranthematis TaxID=2728021 RepID=A0ABX6MEN3_9BURK|nr:hypothetical protein [Duganella dendranthematis]QJD92773.1 hypothetical protein HH213_23400 [Duganella dendranthematis]